MSEYLYHGSRQPVEKLVVLKNDLFHGMFFSDDLEAAESHGENVVKCYVPNDKIIDCKELAELDDFEEVVKKLYPEIGWQTAYDIVSEQLCPWTDDIENLKPFFIKHFHAVDIDEIDFAMQRMCCEIGDAMGYKAIGVYDEHGTSYMVVPVIHLERVDVDG